MAVWVLRCAWFNFHEILLYRACLRDAHLQLTKAEFTDDVIVAKWAGYANLNVHGHETYETAGEDHFAEMILKDHSKIRWNYRRVISELVYLCCRVLCARYNSFAWLTDPDLDTLLGTSIQQLLKSKYVTIERVAQTISDRMATFDEKYSLKYVCEQLMGLKVLAPKPITDDFGTNTTDIALTKSTSQHCEFDEVIELSSNLEKFNMKFYENKDGVTEFALVTTHLDTKNESVVRWDSDSVKIALASEKMNRCWVANSGATKHMTGNSEWVSELRPANIGVKMGGGQVIKATEIE